MVKAECWIHTDVIGAIFPNDDVNHYEKQECIPTTPTPSPATPSDCEIVFVKYEGRMSFTGEERKADKTVEECEEGCKNVSGMI